MVDAAVRKALRETVFRFELVFRINVVAHEMIDRELLLYAAFAGQLALLASEDRQERRDAVHLRRLAVCREVTAGRVSELLAVSNARSIVEGRYLDGRSALSTDIVEAWGERLQLAEELAVMADRLAELDGIPPSVPADADAVAERAEMLVADLVEPARSTALEKLDEGRQALAIATGWLRSKMAPLPAPIDPGGPPVAATP